MSSSLFAFISRTQPPLLFYTIVIPELTAAIFLLHVLGFNFFFFIKSEDLRKNTCISYVQDKLSKTSFKCLVLPMSEQPH